MCRLRTVLNIYSICGVCHYYGLDSEVPSPASYGGKEGATATYLFYTDWTHTQSLRGRTRSTLPGVVVLILPTHPLTQHKINHCLLLWWFQKFIIRKRLSPAQYWIIRHGTSDISRTQSGVTLPVIVKFNACICIYGVQITPRLYIQHLKAWYQNTHHQFLSRIWLCIYSMSNPSPLNLTSKPDGSSDRQDPIPTPNTVSQPPVTPLLDGSRPDHSGEPHQPSHSCYSDALKYGVGSRGGHHQQPTKPESSAQLRTCSPPRILSVTEPVTADPHNSPPILPPHKTCLPSTEELYACCLLGKIWGEPLPLPAIIHRTRNEWKFVKGQIEFIDLGNDWLLIRFANCQDKMLVFDQRPWFVNGLNFVVTNWAPFFDPYHTAITKVDQWVRIPRLPWEFWDLDCLKELLRHVGKVVRVDQNTLLRLKGKFARVCVNLDITEPLPGSITITTRDLSMRVPIIYEWLHEVCPLCGGIPTNLNYVLNCLFPIKSRCLLRSSMPKALRQ